MATRTKKLHIYIHESGAYLTLYRNTRKNYKRVPDTLGVQWDIADQSCNQIVLDLRQRHDYEFDPLDDMRLFEEYTDQIADLLFA